MNLADLTLGEIEQIEDAARLSITAVDDPTAPKARLFAAIGFVVTRRDRPDFTWEQAQAMTIDEVTALMGGDESDDPTSTLKPTG